jgi:5-carboxyvanillate decarboxylase
LYQRIATEEAFATPELLDRYRAILSNGSVYDPGFTSLMGFYLGSTAPGIVAVRERMLDLGDRRLGDMMPPASPNRSCPSRRRACRSSMPTPR